MWDRLSNYVEQQGWEASSHSLTHPWLSRIGVEQLKEELSVSRDVILNNLADAGVSLNGVPTFIYPYGDYGAREIECLRDCGYLLGLTYQTHEGVTKMPDPDDWYEWGYTVNAPEFESVEKLWDVFCAVHKRKEVFSVTTHPPVLRPDKRLRLPNVYSASGTWARFLQQISREPDVWFTTFGTLAAYQRQFVGASVEKVGSGTLEVCFATASAPLPTVPLSITCSVDGELTAVSANGTELPRQDKVGDVAQEGWSYERGRLVVTVLSPGRIDVQCDPR